MNHLYWSEVRPDRQPRSIGDYRTKLTSPRITGNVFQHSFSRISARVLERHSHRSWIELRKRNIAPLDVLLAQGPW